MAIKRLMAKALPDYLVNQVTAEVRLATRRMFTARSVRRSLASQKGCRVNIGCGKNPIQGWINLDVVSYPDVYFWDCRSGLPFSDAAVAAIYSEHFFEHLDAETEARAFLLECLRCLQSQGVIRLVVPDAWAYLRTYSGRRQCHRWLPSSVVQMLKKCGIRLRLSCEETSEIWSFPNGE